MTGTKPATYISLNGHGPQTIDGAVVEEALACISVNGQELATFMCSPHNLDQLALGFLFNEGLIQNAADVRLVRPSKSKTCVDVWLQDAGLELPKRAIVTAGCGGGVTFDDLSQKHEPLDSDLAATPEQLIALMKQLHLGAEMYREARGVHTAVLATHDQVLLQVEDVGRHNCLDKLAGAALQANVVTEDRILLSSGRISSEMINKARRMGIPIICSRTSPTSLSVALAEAWNITIVAYLRQDRMRIYTHPERILGYRIETTRLETK
ncbi:MAG: formate dehydrogenase accessory sulfurtransferase FdhD [Ardenticatenaceae bacterium]|nr:formate dehydrogenase accessory sulfurtransferase FdhD [Ardenticatenaceae bacterium]MCB9444700.1 formate dehydrogenase accessory sulfurtransferase FdhD [Ardenticatenaceae bacterium]